jgi:phage gpG-like protein
MVSMKVEIFGLGKFEETAKAIFDSQKNMHDLLLSTVRIYGQILEREAKEKHLSGPTTDHSLSVVTGRLRSSIRAIISEEASNTITIRFGSDVPYAAIHEFGGSILRKSPTGKAYAITMPKRSFLGSSIDETYPDFQERVSRVLADFAARGFRGQ